MLNDIVGREEAESLWRSRVANAKARYEAACDDVNKIERYGPPSADDQRTMHAEDVARAEYIRVLRLYTDLLINGTIPDEKEWRAGKPYKTRLHEHHSRIIVAGLSKGQLDWWWQRSQ